MSAFKDARQWTVRDVTVYTELFSIPLNAAAAQAPAESDRTYIHVGKSKHDC